MTSEQIDRELIASPFGIGPTADDHGRALALDMLDHLGLAALSPEGKALLLQLHRDAQALARPRLYLVQGGKR